LASRPQSVQLLLLIILPRPHFCKSILVYVGRLSTSGFFNVSLWFGKAPPAGGSPGQGLCTPAGGHDFCKCLPMQEPTNENEEQSKHDKPN